MDLSTKAFIVIVVFSLQAFIVAHIFQFILKSEFNKQERLVDGLTLVAMLAVLYPAYLCLENYVIVPTLAYTAGVFVGLFRLTRLEGRIKLNTELNELQSRFRLAFSMDSNRATVAISEFSPKVMEPFIAYCLKEDLNVISERHHRSGKVFLHISR